MLRLTNLWPKKSVCIVPALLYGAGVFLVGSSCVMTKAHGNKLETRLETLENEIAKLQRVRHDMELLLSGQATDVVDRLARLERQLQTFRESLSEDKDLNKDIQEELQNLRSELVETKALYKNLAISQQSLIERQAALAQKKVQVPSNAKDHFATAKKYYTDGHYDSAIFLFDEYLKKYPNDKEMMGQSNYVLGEIYKKMGDDEKTPESKENKYKKSVVSYQKVIELNNDAVLREEALFNMGIVLKAMGNKEGAKAAFNELISKHKKSKKTDEAKALLSELQNDTR